jgi:hypothetical protein
MKDNLQSNPEKAFIRYCADGSVHISGGLIFFPGICVYSEDIPEDAPRHTLTDSTFYTQLPRWWQLRQWLRLLRCLQAHMLPLKNKNLEGKK